MMSMASQQRPMDSIQFDQDCVRKKLASDLLLPDSATYIIVQATCWVMYCQSLVVMCDNRPLSGKTRH